jgi:hypothetical protein
MSPCKKGICLFDPGIEDPSGSPSSNLGDLIIQGAVERELRRVFGPVELDRISTHAPVPAGRLASLGNYRHLIIGGTNLLSSFMREYKQWEIGFHEARWIRRALMLGVGWWQYQKNPDWYTRCVLLAALSWRGWHSVRDEYTRKKLQTLGLFNVLNTGCPTMWPFLEFDQGSVPGTRSRQALVMLTDYYRNPDLDVRLVKLALARYDVVHFWPQGRKDLEYLDELGLPLRRLDHTMDSLNRFLREGPPVDYLGTRLHGGVHCLLARRRSLIVAVDNRASEMARDTGLPVVQRDDFDGMQRWIDGPSSLNIRLNAAAIERWRGQFRRSQCRHEGCHHQHQ